MKNLIIITLLFFSFSCSFFKKNSFKQQDITIIADSINQNWLNTNSVSISYDDSYGLRRNGINTLTLSDYNAVSIPVYKPVYLNIDNEIHLLAQPKDSLVLNFNKGNLSVKSIDSTRNNEIRFYILLNKLTNHPKFPNSLVNSLSSFELIEKEFKQQIIDCNRKNYMLIDSLQKICKLNSLQLINTDKLKLVTKDSNLREFYLGYKNFLITNDLYIQRLKELNILFNKLEYKNTLTNTFSLNEYAKEVLPLKISSIKTSYNFKLLFDSISSIFKNGAKDYLLSELMFFAYGKQVLISKKYYKMYKKICTDVDYNKIVFNAKGNYKRISKLSVQKLYVVGLNEKKSKTLKSVLIDKYQGKFLILDFWATWCLPCKEDLPYLNSFMKDYEPNKIEIIKVALDRDQQMWHNYLVSSKIGVQNQFNVVGKKDSLYFENMLIESIPRYMLLDQKGKVLDSSLPSPKSPMFRKVIDEYINRKLNIIVARP